ncbi:unnamed protein product [Nezara viridula]|uniref:Hermansky-Pudlak syndrome 1 n=1 Tax=Nezara viridula TaxID=85310 RepID=A0A9P0HCI4_NEZVI|nr:unnamed protein product [Nezara viridula]
MHCILVFDHLNDIVFSKCDKNFVKHIEKLGEKNGLTCPDPENGDEDFNLNFVMQLFSPIVTSQRIMSSQFGNSYTSIQCQDGINMVFDEYMGYLFVNLAFEDIHWLKRMLGICISIVQHLCGPDVSVLKTNASRSMLVMRLIDTWATLVSKDQSVLLEALEQLFVNSDVNGTIIKALKDSTDRIKTLLNYSKSHAVIFVENRFLGLYSSKSARELSSSDLLFLGLMAEMTLNHFSVEEGISVNEGTSSDDRPSPTDSPNSERKAMIKPCSQIAEKPEDNLFSDLVLLSANNNIAVCPYVIHIAPIAEGITLILLYQTQWESLNLTLNDALSAINVITCVSYNEKEGIKRGMESLESAMKKLLDVIKKIKSSDITPRLDACIKVLQVKWDLLKKQYSEGHEMAISSCASSLGVSLRELLQAASLDRTPVQRGRHAAQAIARCVCTAVSHFTDFLKVKAVTNFSLGSRDSLSINKYLEEFPGLVHFLYIDRTNHRLTAPSLQMQPPEPPLPQLTKEKIWTMVEFSRHHLLEGNLALMWRDTTFSYAYYLWFEDGAGSAIKPKVSPATAIKTLPLPGVFNGDFYQRLIETCFPKNQSNKVRCFELYCVHIGLATSSCVLEQSRRIAATICEVTGVPSNPLDLL